MKTNAKITAMLLATSMLVAAPMANLVQASESQNAPAAIEQAAKPVALKTSTEALSAMSAIHDARLALFDGDTDGAKTLVKTALEAFQGDMGSYLIKDAEESAEDAYYLPIESAMRVSKSFVLTDEHNPALQAAGTHMTSGDQKSALQVLIDARIDVQMQAAMLPAAETVAHLKDADNAMSTGKFYDANLALKSIEQSVAIKTFAAADLPQQGFDASKVL